MDGRREPDLADDPGLPRPADPVHPVPRPPLERLEAGRLLGDQRLLQGREEGRRPQGQRRRDRDGRPHGPVRRADRQVVEATSAATPGSGPSRRPSSTAGRSAPSKDVEPPRGPRRSSSPSPPTTRSPRRSSTGCGATSSAGGSSSRSTTSARTTRPATPSCSTSSARNSSRAATTSRPSIRWIMNSDAYNLTSSAIKENEKDETLFSHMNLKPMTPEQLFDSLIVATAAHKAGGEDNSRRRDHVARPVPLHLRQRRGRGVAELPGDHPPGPDDDERRADRARPSAASRAASSPTSSSTPSSSPRARSTPTSSTALPGRPEPLSRPRKRAGDGPARTSATPRTRWP